MTPEDRALIVEIGQAARICAMYRELLEVARRYQNTDEVDRLTHSLAGADTVLSRLIAKALEEGNDASRAAAAGQPPAPADDDAGQGRDDQDVGEDESGQPEPGPDPRPEG